MSNRVERALKSLAPYIDIVILEYLKFLWAIITVESFTYSIMPF